MHIIRWNKYVYIEPINRKNRNIDKYMHIQTYKNLHRQDEPIKELELKDVNITEKKKIM